MILPGETMATVFIPIINDTTVEGPERFNVVLPPNNSYMGVTIGRPRRAEVTIIDDANDSKHYKVIMWYAYVKVT